MHYRSPHGLEGILNKGVSDPCLYLQIYKVHVLKNKKLLILNIFHQVQEYIYLKPNRFLFHLVVKIEVWGLTAGAGTPISFLYDYSVKYSLILPKYVFQQLLKLNH
jgi:hypothetical protein